MKLIIGEHMKLLVKYLKLRLKVKRMERTTTEIIEENRMLHEIIADLQNGGMY